MKFRDVVFAGSFALLALFALSSTVSAGGAQDDSAAGSTIDRNATYIIFTDDDVAGDNGACVCSADGFDQWADTAQCVSG